MVEEVERVVKEVVERVDGEVEECSGGECIVLLYNVSSVNKSLTEFNTVVDLVNNCFWTSVCIVTNMFSKPFNRPGGIISLNPQAEVS